MTEYSKPNQDADELHINKFVEFMKAKALYKDKETKMYKKKPTHTLMGPLHKDKHPWQGSFSIRNTEYDRFLKLYKNVYGKIPLYIVERPNDAGKMVGPLIIDIDYKTTVDERLYTKDHLESIIDICNGYFERYLDIETDKIRAYVLEKDKASYDEKNKKYKDGFHISYDVPLSYNRRKFLFDKIKKKITEDDVFGDIDHDSSYDDIVDESVLIDNGILMYGSQKLGRKPYKLTYVYNFEVEEEPTEDYQDPDELINVFSLRQYIDDDDTPFKYKYKEDELKLEENDYYSKEKEKEKEKKKEKEKGNENDNDNYKDEFKYAPHGSYPLNNLPKEYKKLSELIDILSVKRATGYDGWIHVCWALNAISSKLYRLFAYFSKKAQNYDEKSCYQIWSKANREKSGLTIASIKMWAKQDDPEKYQDLHYKKLKDLVMKIENPNHDDIANVVVEMYRDQYKCVSIKGNSWYEFQDHHWVPVDSAYTLQEKIASEVTQEFHGISNYFWKDSTNKSGIDRDDTLKQIKRLLDTVLKLKDQNYGTTLIKTCARKLYDSKFEESLDNNPYLIGFENGVYDLRTMTFRDGMSDDRLTLSTGYDYVEFSEDHECVQQLNGFLRKLQPKNHIRDYVLRLFSSFLDGRNKDQQFRLFTGSGSNGKSKMLDLLDATLGKYSGSLPPEILTIRNNSPNGATPFLADKKGLRFLSIQEPEGDSTIQVGKMKGLTGGDAVPARKLFGDPFSYRPQFKIVLVCNKKPKIPADDEGTWRRIRDIQWKSKFVGYDKVDESKHHYLRDEEIDEKLIDWAPAFMWMLINQYYPKYNKDPKEGGGLQEPSEVTADSRKYRKESDVFHEFLSEMVEFTGNEKDSEKIVLLFAMFKDWHRDNYNQGTKFARKDLEEYLEEKKEWKCDKGTVLGVKGIWGD